MDTNTDSDSVCVVAMELWLSTVSFPLDETQNLALLIMFVL